MNHLPEYSDFVKQPLAPVVLRIGIAGHRPHKLPKDSTNLRNSISSAFEDIDTCLKNIAKEPIAARIYKRGQSPQISILSSLAEGIDRWCTEADIVGSEFKLTAVLPYPQVEYEKTFAQDRPGSENGNADSVNEFRSLLAKAEPDSPASRVVELSGRDKQGGPYQQCSEFIAQHCDILIAVYDGNDTEYKGSSASAQAARAVGIPVIHISTLGRHAKSLYVAPTAGEAPVAQRYTLDLLQKELNRILLFEDILCCREDCPDYQDLVLERFDTFVAEDNLAFNGDIEPDFQHQGPIGLICSHKKPFGKAFDHFKQVFSIGGLRGRRIGRQKQSDTTHSIVNTHDDKELVGDLCKRTSHRYNMAYMRADLLADYYSRAHRSTFLMIYLLGALALSTAAIALAVKTYHLASIICVVIELVLLSCIYYIYKRDHVFDDYHDKWLEYRCLAEFLRPMRYLSVAGVAHPIASLREHDESLERELLGHKNLGRSWVYIYTRTLIRWAGLSGFAADNSSLEKARTFVVNKWVNDQITYHRNNAEKMELIGHRLGQVSVALFFLTFGIAVIKLLSLTVISDCFPSGSLQSYLVGLSVAILPIFASAAFAIRHHAEFDLSAQRSLTMRSVLLSRVKKINSLKGSQFTLSGLSTSFRSVATSTIRETADWLEIFEVKETEPG